MSAFKNFLLLLRWKFPCQDFNINAHLTQPLCFTGVIDNWDPKKPRDSSKVIHLRVTERGLIPMPSQMLLQKGHWCVWSGFRQQVLVQRQICRDSQPYWVSLRKGAVVVWQPIEPLKTCSPLHVPLLYSRKILGKLKPWYKWRQLEFYLILCPHLQL